MDVLVKILPLLGRKVELSRVAIAGGVYERRGPTGTVVLNDVGISGGFTWNSETGGVGPSARGSRRG